VKVVRDCPVQNFKFEDTRLKISAVGKTYKAGGASQVEILLDDY
jgi:hypothetical protein